MQTVLAINVRETPVSAPYANTKSGYLDDSPWDLMRCAYFDNVYLAFPVRPGARLSDGKRRWSESILKLYPALLGSHCLHLLVGDMDASSVAARIMIPPTYL